MTDRPQTFSVPSGYARTMFSAWMHEGSAAQRRERRRILIAIGGSALIHALLLLMTVQMNRETTAQQGGADQVPITVRLVRPAARAPAPQVATIPVQPQPQARPPRRKRLLTIPPKPDRPSQKLPAEPPPPAADPAAPTDMMAMVQAARERRRAAEEAAARINAEARAGEETSPNDIAMQNIRRSLQSARNDGTNGIFQVLSKGVRTGSFVFRGWTPGARNSTQQTFEVDAGPDGNVELALVRKMIELIRKHYTGDFNWESQRLGRVMVMSARLQDSAALEAFLMKEFFGDEEGARR